LNDSRVSLDEARQRPKKKMLSKNKKKFLANDVKSSLKTTIFVD
jgi:hypothetical protein